MKWNRKRRWSQWIGLLLTIIVISGSLLGVKTAELAEPENAIVQENERLSMEVMEGSGTGNFQNSGDMQTEKEVEPKDEREEEPEEPEEPEKPEDPEEPEEPEDLGQE